MNILAIYLAPYDTEDDVSLCLYPCEPTKEAIYELIANKYDLVPETFKYWEAHNHTFPSGQFTTNETVLEEEMDPAFTLDWWFEIIEVRP